MEQRLAGFRTLLPQSFAVPRRFDEILHREEPPDIDPWWWLFPYHELNGRWAQTITSQYPARTPLIPFAKHAFTDDVFCFDGADTSGNPRVFIVHTYASPGWEDRGYWDDFDVFMEAAEEEHADWLREQAESSGGDR